MTNLSFALRDSATMLRRDAKHSLRYPAMTISGLAVPIIMMLLFDYVFGGAIGAGLGGVAHGVSYINYLLPGIIIMCVASGCESTAISLCMDMSEGIIARFRTMAIARASVLSGQVLGSLIRTLITVVFVFGVALLMGFRSNANPVAWIAALGIVALITFGVTWMGVAFGLVGKTPAGANSLSLIFTLLVFTSSAFVSPTLMPTGIRWFTEYQPFTPVIDTVRSLLLGTPISGSTVIIAIVWCVVLSLVGYFWSMAVYNRNSVRFSPAAR